MNDTQIVILAGGQGSRFWPVSRATHPKQFLKVAGSETSLITSTADRVRSLSSQPPLVVTNKLHVPLVEEHVSDAEVLAEPVARNTAAAVGLAAIKVAHTNPEAVMVMLPADHIISRPEVFREVLSTGIEYAKNHDELLTIGISPTFPHTGYGYIQCSEELGDIIYRTHEFHEKPSKEKAVGYLQQGNYYWNSGMFMWRASVILDSIETLLPELHAGLMKIASAIGTEEETSVIAAVFPELQSVSIDVGVMEKASNRATLVGPDFGWSDVGSWDVWADFLPSDECGNLATGDLTLIDSSNNIAVSNGRHMALIGVENLIVIETDDAVLVCNKDDPQQVKKVVEQLKQKQRAELL